MGWFIGVGLLVCVLGYVSMTAAGVWKDAKNKVSTYSVDTKDDESRTSIETPGTEEMAVQDEPANEPEFEPLSEEEFQSNLHEMTHQKVYADVKRGFLKITPERIDEMLKMLDQTNYEREDTYRQWLTKWKAGDFSNAVEVHNSLWQWDNGEIGKATRLLTPEEEQRYIASLSDEDPSPEWSESQ